MFLLRPNVVVVVLAIVLMAPVYAIPQQDWGAIEVNVKRVKVDGKPANLTRKRFYLIPGGFEENAALLERIKTAEITSRNCYYKGLKASDQYICWLQSENCESPFCRVVEPRYFDANDKQFVPEFLASYNKGLSLFKGKSDIAREWVITNMPDNLVNGYYRQQQQVLASLLGGVKPIQSSMTDSAGIRTIFLDIAFPGTETKTKYLISNILPIEIGDKSYVWTCEKDIESGKKVLLDLSRKGKDCEVTERTLNLCETAACEQK